MRSSEGNNRGAIARAGRLLLFFAGSAFILALIIHGRGELQAAISGANWSLCIGSLFLALVSNYISVLAFSAFLSKHGQDLDPGTVTRMLMYGQVAKYVPGKVWGLIYQAMHLGVALPGIRIVALTNLELMMIGVIANAAVAIGLIVLFSFPILSGFSFIIGLLLSLCVYVYRGYQPLLRYLQRWIPNLGADELATWSRRGIIYVGSYYSSVWVFYLTGALLLLGATTDLTLQQAALTLALMNIAWIVSIIIFVFPAGIGVREVLFVWLTYQFGGEVSLEQIAVVAVIFRFWQVALDILGAALAWLFTRGLGRCL